MEDMDDAAKAALQQKIDEKYIFRNPMLNFLIFHWKGIVTVLTPFILSPIMIMNSEDYCIVLYVTLLMSIYWITEVIPIYATGMIPIVIFPLALIFTSDEVCGNYFKNVTVLFIGSLMASAAIEHSKLHRRIAFGFIRAVGFSASRIHFSIMFVTFVLSFWISNAAATVLMCPIVSAMLVEMESQGVGNRFDSKKEFRLGKPQPSPMATCLYISVCYAATLGGCAVVVGSPSNLAFKTIYETKLAVPISDSITFGKFTAYAGPSMVIIFIFTYIYLECVYMGLLMPKSENAQAIHITREGRQAAKAGMTARYEELGKWTIHQIVVVVGFSILIIGYFTHEPGFTQGWGELFAPYFVRSNVVTITTVIIFFLIPIHCNCFNYCAKTGKETAPYSNVVTTLNWGVLHKNVSWGLIFLFGGGFALSSAAIKTGLDEIIGDKLTFLADLPNVIVLLISIVFIEFLTLFYANTAMINILTPVVIQVSKHLQVHPLYLVFPLGITASMAFLFPISTPPNAMVAEYGNISTKEMIRAGIGPTIISMIVLFVFAVTYASLIYPGLDIMPEWALGVAGAGGGGGGGEEAPPPEEE